MTSTEAQTQELWAAQAKVALKEKRFEDAVQACGQALEACLSVHDAKSLQSAGAHFAYGEALLKQVQHNSDLFGDSVSRAEDQQQQVQIDTAEDLELAFEMLEIARIALEHQPQSNETSLKLANTLEACGDVSSESEAFAQALSDYSKCLAIREAHLDPWSKLIADAHMSIACTNLTASNVDDALLHFAKAARVLVQRVQWLLPLKQQPEQSSSSSSGSSSSSSSNHKSEKSDEVDLSVPKCPDLSDATVAQLLKDFPDQAAKIEQAKDAAVEIELLVSRIDELKSLEPEPENEDVKDMIKEAFGGALGALAQATQQSNGEESVGFASSSSSSSSSSSEQVVHQVNVCSVKRKSTNQDAFTVPVVKRAKTDDTAQPEQ